MRIAVVSDTHSRYQTVEKVLRRLSAERIDVVLHCGDIEDAKTVQLFHEFQAHFVYGNCDWDKPALRRQIEEIGGTLHQPFGKLYLEGRRIAWAHGDDKRLLQEIEESGQYDFLFYGHSHLAEQHHAGPTLVVNPGALYRAKPKTFVIVNLPGRKIESVRIE